MNNKIYSSANINAVQASLTQAKKQLARMIDLNAQGLVSVSELDDAKAQGLVGEKASGYLGIPNQQAVSEDVITLIKDINNKRKAKYIEIALKNNLKTDAVAKLANKKAIEKTEVGNYYQTQDGKWLKK